MSDEGVANHVSSFAQLEDSLRRIDGRGYKAYKSIKGHYGDAHVTLFIDHVQGDPFAEASRFRISIDHHTTHLPQWAIVNRGRCVSSADFLNRKLCGQFERYDGRCGSGKGGQISVLKPGQQVLARTSVVVSCDGRMEVRFRLGLPAQGRRVLGYKAATLISDVVEVVCHGGSYHEDDKTKLLQHIQSVEDAEAIRVQLKDLGLVAFVGEGAIIPRRSGVDDRPLGATATAFESPPELELTVSTPHQGPVKGMGVPKGITLICGGGYHGKSTLLKAIEKGIYNHIPGDGRQRVVTLSEAVKVRAEDGRRVTAVDIDPFISGLPGSQDTRRFTTDNASGSTSQAAAIVEALDLGCKALLLDEDTCATNFMIRDARMQRLVVSDDEPITPFIDRAAQIYNSLGVSLILVVGGAGDYFDIADTVIGMRSYRPYDATSRAKEIAEQMPQARETFTKAWRRLERREIDLRSIDLSKGRRDVHIKVQSADRALMGREEVDLSALSQLVERGQTLAIAESLYRLTLRAVRQSYRLPIDELVSWFEGKDAWDMDDFSDAPKGDFVSFRVYECGAFLNRLRSLDVCAPNDVST
jgi:predicted ABC-class ATPase